jgi:hypothetical protein
MNAREACLPPPAACARLKDFLRRSGSTLSPAEALDNAIQLWIDTETAPMPPSRGYQWKSLFLPNGTGVRMQYGGEYFHAEVMDEELIYQAKPTSPHRLATKVAGTGRNAWRDLWVRLPGEKNWTCANLLRIRQAKQAAALPASPAEALTTATKTMGDALHAALLLIEHVDHQSKTLMERRLPKRRREYDELSDDH